MYKYNKGILLGEYDFENQKFPLLKFGDFRFTYKTGYYPGALFINFPDNFKPELPLETDKAQKILEKSLKREQKQKRKVYPMITFKLVSATPPNEDQINESLRSNSMKKSTIVGFEQQINQMESDAGLPTSSRDSRTNEELSKLNEADKYINAKHGERLDAVVTSLVIYSRPFHLIANQEELFNIQYK